MVSPYAFTWSQGDMCTVLYATRPTTPPMDAATPMTSIHITWSVGAPVKNRPKAFKNCRTCVGPRSRPVRAAILAAASATLAGGRCRKSASMLVR